MPLVSFSIYLPLKLSIKTNIHNSSQTLADYKAMSEPLLLEPVHGLRVTLCAVVFGSAIDRFSNLRRLPTHHFWSLQNAPNALHSRCDVGRCYAVNFMKRPDFSM
jgi:hypothetical protein